MRRSLFSSLPLIVLFACNANSGKIPVQSEPVTTDSSSITTQVVNPDTSAVHATDEAILGTPKSNTGANEASKELKASRSETATPVQVPDVPGSGVREHGSPNKSALDSLKEAKSKGKK